MSRKGTISVQTQDILPIIKKWLYSEHDIFFRELTSNSCDAITKRASISRSENLEMVEGKINITLDKANKTISIEDNGLGMTEDEVEKYIAQLAFSGAQEFVDKMNESGKNEEDSKGDIIGKFGLGFYSAFMVADKVEVDSLSYQKDAHATKWTCEGETDYEFTDSDRTEVGTRITLHLNEDSMDFINSYKSRETLSKYCDFMPYSIELIDLETNERIVAENLKAEKEEDKKPVPCDIINASTPLWKKDPKTITDEEYKDFFKKLYPMEQEPLFWLHLNVDHPFTLQGILYFPKFNPSKPTNDKNIKLYCRQVFVSDNIKEIIPEFLGLIKGAIDSTDIPLNVSRSALQGDPNVKKISNYIVKKVAESLKKLFKNDRERYDSVWEDIALFVKYGVVSDTKFDELMRPYVLFKNSEEKFVTIEEYRDSIPSEFKEKLGDTVINFEKEVSDSNLRKQLLTEGVHALETENYIDPHFMQHTEMQKQGERGLKWSTVDAEIENILASENTTDEDMKIQDFFKQVLVGETKEGEPATLEVEIKKFKDSTSAAYFKVDQQMKRLQQMTQQMGNNAFNMPVKKTLVLNPSNPLIQNALKIWEKGDKKDLAEKICHHVQDLATISSEGLEKEEKSAFVTRSQNLISELSNLAL
jgi:molecular chaperone HtpG